MTLALIQEYQRKQDVLMIQRLQKYGVIETIIEDVKVYFCFPDKQEFNASRHFEIGRGLIDELSMKITPILRKHGFYSTYLLKDNKAEFLIYKFKNTKEEFNGKSSS